MTTVRTLDELDQLSVAQKLQTLQQLISEALPAAQVRHGVFSDLVLHAASMLGALRDEDIDRLRRSSSLLEITTDPVLAVDEYVDAVLSNYNVARKTGTRAAGAITIVLSAAVPISIPSGAVFESGSVQFQTAQPYSAVLSATDVTSSSDRVLTARGDGNYSFSVEVEAIEEGLAGMLKKDTLLTAKVGISDLVKVVAASDFTGGTETETNASAMLRLAEGIANRSLSGRTNINSVIRDALPAASSISIVGFGSAEMIRDQHSIFPVSFGGRVDCYVQTAELPISTAVTKTCALVSRTVDNRGTWQASFTRNEFPGFYDVLEIKPAAAGESVGSLALLTDTRSMDLAGIFGLLTPDIVDTIEGVYSRYQTVTIQFSDTITDTTALSLGDTQDYLITLRGMPDLDDLQTALAARDPRNPAGDVLGKAPVPCFVRLSFALEGRPGSPLPDYMQIRQSLARYVNSLGFVGRLSASALTDIIYDSLPNGFTVGALDMYGQIRRPAGTVKSLRSSETLVIPYEPTALVTARTTLFLLDPRSIEISLRAVNMP